MPRDLRDLVERGAVHVQVAVDRGDVEPFRHAQLGEFRRLRRHHDHGVIDSAGDGVDRFDSEQPAGTDDDEVVGEDRQLADEMARDEDRAAGRNDPGEPRAQPTDALGVEAVRRFVEQQHVGFAEERAGERESLAHAEREAARPPVGDRVEPHLAEHLVDRRVAMLPRAVIDRR